MGFGGVRWSEYGVTWGRVELWPVCGARWCMWFGEIGGVRWSGHGMTWGRVKLWPVLGARWVCGLVGRESGVDMG